VRRLIYTVSEDTALILTGVSQGAETFLPAVLAVFGVLAGISLVFRILRWFIGRF